MNFKLLNNKQIEMTQFLLTPDRTVNNKKVHDLFRSLSSFYASPLDVIRGKIKGALWFDVMLRHDEIAFYCTIPSEWKREIKLQLESVWPLSSIEEVEIHTAIPDASIVCEMKYRRSNIFALQIDRRTEIEPLNSILSITSEMHVGDLARLSICAEPVGRLDWQDWAEKQHKEFKKGKTPKRTRVTKRDLFISIGEMITDFLQSIMDTIDTATGDKPKKNEDDYEKRQLMIDGSLSRGTVNKLKTPTFNTYIRIASHSPDQIRQQIILRTLSNSFNDLTADNELERADIHPKLQPGIVNELNTFKLSYLTRLDWDKNKMSNEELSRLVELPTAALQDVYKGIESLDMRQIQTPKLLLDSKGISFGNVSYKKQKEEVYFPTGNWDELCLSSVIIAKKGQGKTKGFACNRAVEYAKQGYSAIVFDVADSEVWDVISKALPENKRQRILLGNGQKPISLDFSEVKYSPEAKGRLSEIILSFFEDNTDTAGAQTQRFLRAAVMSMKTGKLSEIVKIFKDAKYRENVLSEIPKESIHRESLIEFGGYSADRQRQILSPILNRLDIILGSPYLSQCMESENVLDVYELLHRKGMVTVLDIPDDLNSRSAQDLLVNLLSFKIDISTPFRKKADRFPVAVFYDEPHKFLKSVKLFTNFVAESRKYRLAYHFLFHSWKQIPSDFAQIIKDTGCHFFLYPSSEETFKGLAQVIQPLTVSDGLNLEKYHAICALAIGDKRLTPFICKMSAPPTI